MLNVVHDRLNQMSDLVKGKPFAEMTHEGIKFLIKELARDISTEIQYISLQI